MLASVAILFAVLLGQGNQPPQPEPEEPSLLWTFMPILVLVPLYYFMIFLPEKQRKERVTRLEAVKEKDHVVTTSGIHGVVTNVQKNQGYATIRIDESTGTKIRIDLGAIARVVSDEVSASGDGKQDKNQSAAKS